MGVYLFQGETLVNLLGLNEDDFGKEIIPRAVASGVSVYVYDFETQNTISDYIVEVIDGKRRKVMVRRTRDSGYWKDVGTIDSYFDASMDLIGVDPIFSLYAEVWPIRTFTRWLPPTKYILGGMTFESLVSDGCIISGGVVRNSIMSPGVVVERGAMVMSSVIFDDVVIEPNARVNRAIIDKECIIQTGASIGYDLDYDKKRGFTVSPGGVVVISKGTTVGPLL
jgi:glucose-1-phosphate adenylyltransferase